MINQKSRIVENFLRGFASDNPDEAQKFVFTDPTIMGFSLFFYFAEIPETVPYSSLSPLFNVSDPNVDSAYFYLKNIGEPERAESILDFKNRLQEINRDMPFMFTNIEGLGQINTFNRTDPFRARDRAINITTLETLDLKVATMIQRYMNAVYDFDFGHREMVPSNLREFTMEVHFYEIRDFKRWTGNVYGENSLPEFTIVDKNLFGLHRYILRECEFDFSESNPFFESVSNEGQNEIAFNNFSIKFGKIEDWHDLGLGELLLSGDNRIPKTNLPTKPGLTTPADISPSFGFNNQNAVTDAVSGNLLTNGVLGTVIDAVRSRTGEIVDFTQDVLNREVSEFRELTDLNAIGARLTNEFFDRLDSRVRSFLLQNVFDKYSEFTRGDGLETIRAVLDDLRNNEVERTNLPGSVEVAQPGTSARDRLRGAAVSVQGGDIEFNRVALENIGDAFVNTPISAILNRVTEGSLSSVSVAAAADAARNLGSVDVPKMPNF